MAKWVAFVPFNTSWDAHPEAPQPKTDGTAKTTPTLHVFLTGLQDRERETREEKDRRKIIKVTDKKSSSCC